jgi:hypothetical protein
LSSLPEPTGEAIAEAELAGGTGERLLVIKELDAGDGKPGRTLGLTEVAFQPLDYATLADARLHEGTIIPIAINSALVVDTDIEGLPIGSRVNLKTKLDSPFTSRAIGLVRGGWLPSGLAKNDNRMTLLVDRNIVSEILGRFGGAKERSGVSRDFMDMFADEPVRINPMLHIMEGNGRRPPTEPEAIQELAIVVPKLQAVLPKAEIIATADSIKGMMGLIADTSAGMARRAQMLIQLAPLLGAPTSRRNLSARWHEALATADAHGVERRSIAVIAVLSAIAVPNGRSPARRLLKFRPGYGEADAYNALSDLRSLELLINLLARFPDHPAQLCTADRDLALFWVGLDAHGFEVARDGGTFQMSPVEALLPGVSDDDLAAIGLNGAGAVDD